MRTASIALITRRLAAVGDRAAELDWATLGAVSEILQTANGLSQAVDSFMSTARKAIGK